jgi:peptidoglycan/LPS O-acetylase OafA/YrhL
LSRSSFYRQYAVCLILGLTIPLYRSIENRFLKIPSKIIAKYSYGIYLSHFFCIWFAFQKLGALPVGIRLLVFIATVSFIPVILFHMIEDPCIKLGKKVSDKFILDRVSRTLPVDPKFELQPSKGQGFSQAEI